MKLTFYRIVCSVNLYNNSEFHKLMKINRTSDIIGKSPRAIRIQADKQNRLNESIHLNTQVLSHFNPINRPKCKLSDLKSLSKRQPANSQVNSQSWRVFAVSQISGMNRSEEQKEKEQHPVILELLGKLRRRVQKSERQIENIKKYYHDQENGNLKSGSSRVGSDFKQIKDLYLLIRDQNMIQSQFNKRINDEITQIKQYMSTIKSHLDNLTTFDDSHTTKKSVNEENRRNSNYWNVTNERKQRNYSIKQAENKFSTVEYNFNTKHLKSLNKNQTCQLNNKITQLSSKYEHIMSKIKQIETNTPVLGYVTKRSGIVCEKLGSIGIHIKIDESVRVEDSWHMISQSERLYYIDKDGYLLDKNKYYLLNDQNEMIRIHQDQLLKIKQKCRLVL